VIRARFVLLALAALTGCERVSLFDDVHPPALVDLVVDGRPRGVLAVEGERRPLLELLPADLVARRDGWTGIEGRSGDRRRLTINDPASRYKDHVAYLSEAGGEVSLGWWVERPDAVRARKSPRLELRGLVALEVLTRPRASTTPSLAVSVDGAPGSIDGEALDRLDTAVGGAEGTAGDVRGSGQRAQRQRGWRLIDVVGLAAPADEVVAVEVVAGAERRSFPREALLAAGGTNTMLKRNARGELILRDYADGKAPATLRGVERLEINRRPRPTARTP
jgi:hypothetical protein